MMMQVFGKEKQKLGFQKNNNEKPSQITLDGFYFALFFLKGFLAIFSAIIALLTANRFLVFGDFFDFTCCDRVVPRFAIDELEIIDKF